MPDQYRRLAEMIATNDCASFGHGVSEEIIADSERHLGVSFPPSYRWWLLNYGSGYLNGYELQGLAPELINDREPGLPYIGDVVYLAKINATRPGYQTHLLEILSYEGDEIYFLDTKRRDRHNECPVICAYACKEELEDVAPNFAKFLERKLTI